MKQIFNYWEYWGCPEDVKVDCPAFLTYHGMDCDDFSENYCPKTDTTYKKENTN